MAESVTVEYFGLGTPRLGLWCEQCLLSSAYEVDLYLSISGQPPQVMGTHKGCSGCGEEGELPSPLDDPSDCRHGCNGDCLTSGSEVCNFTCHAPEV